MPRAWSDSGYANAFVRDALNARSGERYGSRRAAFAAWNIRLDVVSTEKVLMAAPAGLPYGDSLLAAGADPRRRLPFDAIVWFRLRRGVN